MFLRSHTKGYIDLTRGTVDITDPCYDKDVWCRMNAVEVKPDRYKCYAWVGDRFEQFEINALKEEWESDTVKGLSYTKVQTVDEYIKARENMEIGRVFVIGIVSEKHLTENLKNYFTFSDDLPWEEIGTIGVDAGLAGFFPDKPDFNDKEWSDLCSYMGNDNIFRTKLGFWTGSGYGDGVYRVSAIRDKNNTIVGLKIEFN